MDTNRIRLNLIRFISNLPDESITYLGKLIFSTFNEETSSLSEYTIPDNEEIVSLTRKISRTEEFSFSNSKEDLLISSNETPSNSMPSGILLRSENDFEFSTEKKKLNKYTYSYLSFLGRSMIYEISNLVPSPPFSLVFPELRNPIFFPGIHKQEVASSEICS